MKFLCRQLSADPAQIAHARSQGSQKLPTSLSPSAPAFELYQSSPKPSPPPPQIIDRPSQPAHIKQVHDCTPNFIKTKKVEGIHGIGTDCV